MTDKEIIIDGVDVSGCEYACNTAFGKNGCKHPMMKNIYCFKNPNCYFKQLSRKTAECEKYEQALDEIEEIAKSFNKNELCFYKEIDECDCCDMGADCNYLRRAKILYTISKAKDGK